MKYDEALKHWGAFRLTEAGYQNVDVSTVRVDMEFNEGWNCCGGTDPECYCSMVESPSANVQISAVADLPPGFVQSKGVVITEIPHYSFDFASILAEIVQVADGIEA